MAKQNFDLQAFLTQQAEREARQAELQAQRDAQQAQRDALIFQHLSEQSARLEEQSERLETVIAQNDRLILNTEQIKSQLLYIGGVAVSVFANMKPEIHEELQTEAENFVAQLEEVVNSDCLDETEKLAYITDGGTITDTEVGQATLKELCQKGNVKVDYDSLSKGQKQQFSCFVAEKVRELTGVYFSTIVKKASNKAFLYPKTMYKFISLLAVYYFDPEQYSRTNYVRSFEDFPLPVLDSYHLPYNMELREFAYN